MSDNKQNNKADTDEVFVVNSVSSVVKVVAAVSAIGAVSVAAYSYLCNKDQTADCDEKLSEGESVQGASLLASLRQLGRTYARSIRPETKASPQENIDQEDNQLASCPGVDAVDAGTNENCDGCPNQRICASGEAVDAAKIAQMETQLVASRLEGVQNIILVLSGKGGVGKSTCSTLIAKELANQGFSVGLVDVDICGPSIPRMTQTSDGAVRRFAGGWLPVQAKSQNGCLMVMSVGFLQRDDPDAAVIWRGARKTGLIKQFFSDIYWGDLDYLIVDTPPGTSDEHLALVQYLKGVPQVRGAVVVTTPQEVSCQDVRKELSFCQKANVNVLGVVENLCGDIFDDIGDELDTLPPHELDNVEDPADSSRPLQDYSIRRRVIAMCKDMKVPYAGYMDKDRTLMKVCDEGTQLPDGCRAHRQLKYVMEQCIPHIEE